MLTSLSVNYTIIAEQLSNMKMVDLQKFYKVNLLSKDFIRSLLEVFSFLFMSNGKNFAHSTLARLSLLDFMRLIVKGVS